MKKLIDFFKRIKSQMFSTPSGQSISRWILVLILILDFQILYFVVDGAKSSANFIEYPENPVPTFCHILFFQFPSADVAFRVNFITGLKYESEYFNEQKVANGCLQARKQIDQVKLDSNFHTLINQLEENRQKIEDEQINIQNIKNSYNTALLEKVAGQPQEDSILKSSAGQIKKDIESSELKIASLKMQQSKIDEKILALDPVDQFIQLSTRKDLKADIDVAISEYSWQLNLRPIKRLIASILFLLPILVLALYWNSNARRKNSTIQVMASTHLLVISILPILFKLSYFVVELLPEAFFTQFFEFLQLFRISFLWNYILILLTLGFFSILFWGSHKIINNPTRRRKNQILKHECWACDGTLESNAVRFCYFCGQGQFIDCKKCAQAINRKFHHCPSCGEKL